MANPENYESIIERLLAYMNRRKLRRLTGDQRYFFTFFSLEISKNGAPPVNPADFKIAIKEAIRKGHLVNSTSTKSQLIILSLPDLDSASEEKVVGQKLPGECPECGKYELLIFPENDKIKIQCSNCFTSDELLKTKGFEKIDYYCQFCQRFSDAWKRTEGNTLEIGVLEQSSGHVSAILESNYSLYVVFTKNGKRPWQRIKEGYVWSKLKGTTENTYRITSELETAFTNYSRRVELGEDTTLTREVVHYKDGALFFEDRP